MTGEFLCFAGMSFFVFENYIHMGDADFDLYSDDCLAGTEKDVLFSFPVPDPYNCRFAGKIIRF